jgi:hypothetical protein
MPELVEQVRILREAGHGAPAGESPAWFVAAGVLAGNSLGLLSSEELEGVWIHPAWVADPRQLSEPARAVLAAFDAAARRDVQHMRPTALAALESVDPHTTGVLREELLVLAMLGAIGQHDSAAVPAIESRYGRDIPPSLAYAPIRFYLLAWAEGHAQR